MSQFFADLIDNVVTAFGRLMELPAFVLVLLLLIPFIGILSGAYFVGKKVGVPLVTASRVKIALAVFGILTVLMLQDQKQQAIMMEFRELNGRLIMAQSGAPDSVKSEPDRLLFSKEQVKKGLDLLFKKHTLSYESQDPSMDFVHIAVPSPEEKQIFMTVIDLTDPEIRIRITPEFKDKWLTSEFARKYDCIVAVNGEAGNSPALKSGLGDWIGNWISDGKPVMLADTVKRPFISFDRQNKPAYSPAKTVDTGASPDRYNVIWGRFDLVVDGAVIPKEPTRYSRTIIGIDKSGSRLILMVVDAQRPGYSIGIGLPDAGRIMVLFGAFNAMSCDQGGSSCMYLKSRNGIVSRPSDGRERPVYCHFGISRVRG